MLVSLANNILLFLVWLKLYVWVFSNIFSSRWNPASPQVFPHPLFSKREALKDFRLVVHGRCFCPTKTEKVETWQFFPKRKLLYTEPNSMVRSNCRDDLHVSLIYLFIRRYWKKIDVINVWLMELNGSCMMILYWSNSFSGGKKTSSKYFPRLLLNHQPFPSEKYIYFFATCHPSGLCCLQEGCRQVLVGEELLGWRLGWKWQLGWTVIFRPKDALPSPIGKL